MQLQCSDDCFDASSFIIMQLIYFTNTVSEWMMRVSAGQSFNVKYVFFYSLSLILSSVQNKDKSLVLIYVTKKYY